MRGYKAHTVRDQIRFLTNAARLRPAAFAVIDKVQGLTPGEQILGAAVALIAMTQSAGINLNDVMSTAGRVMADVDGPFNTHLKAIRDFAHHEIAGGEEYRA